MDFITQYRGLLERYGNGGIDRRTFLGRIARTAVAYGITGSALLRLAGAAQAAETLRYDGYGGVSQGAFSKLVLEPFTAKTGKTVNQGSFGSQDQMLSRIQADGVENYSFFNCSEQGTALRVVRLGYAAQLDESKIPRLVDVVPRAVESYRKLGGGKLPGVPFGLSGGWLGFNTDQVTRAEMEEKGYKILIDPKYKGRATGLDLWMQRIWFAALQDGQDPNAIKDMNAVWDKIRTAKNTVVKFWHSSAEQMQLFSSGSAVVGDAWFVPGYNLKKQGVHFDTWPAQGAYVDFGSFMVLKSAPMDAVYEILDILLRPEVMIPLGVAVGNVPLLDPKKHPMPPEVQQLPGYDPTGTLAGYRTFDPFYWTDHADAWQKEYQRVIARS